MESAHANGIIDAYTDNFTPEQVFLPNKPATRSDVFGFVYQVLVKEDGTTSTDAPGQSTLKNNGDGSQTYVSATGDFQFSFPTNLTVTEEDVVKGNYTTAVAGEGAGSAGGTIDFEVSQIDCVDICIDQYDTFYAHLKSNLQTA